jgi:hypothetical protein
MRTLIALLNFGVPRYLLVRASRDGEGGGIRGNIYRGGKVLFPSLFNSTFYLRAGTLRVRLCRVRCR